MAESIRPAAGGAQRSRSGLARLWEYGSAYRGRVRTATAFTVANKIFDLAPPVLIGLVVDVVANDGASALSRLGIETPRSQVLAIAVATLVVWVAESAFEFLYELWWRNLAQDIQHELRISTYTHLQELDHDYLESRSTGDLMAVLNDDVNQLERFLDDGAAEVIFVITTVISVGALFFWVAPGLAWLSFVPMPVILYGSFWWQRRLEGRYEAVRNQAGFLNSQLANRLLGISTIKSFTAEAREADQIAADSAEYREANRRAIVLSSAFVPLIRMAILAGFVATLIWGGLRALEGGTLSVGEYSTMLYMTQRLLWPLTRLGDTFDQYQRAMASTRRILDVLDTEPGVVGGDRALFIAHGSGGVRFDDVTFTYPSANGAGAPKALDRVTIECEPGRTTAIVGATGSGKSTLVKLLLRFHDCDAGAITVDGHDVRHVDLAGLRASTGLVSQDVYLFAGTVAENIRYGRPEATDAEVVAAARVAEAHDFICELVDGYETVVGERGQRLSGGQRQRVSIARAVLKDPPILVLDEATSSVDNETEAAIQRSLSKLSENRTAIVIAHRLSTIRHADRIYVLDRGRVVESGTHEDLVAHEGVYSGLWAVQTGNAVRA